MDARFHGHDKNGRRELSEAELLQNKAFIDELQSTEGLTKEIFQIFSHQLQEVNSIKISFSDTSTLFLDSQFHTVWSAQYIPHFFNNTEYKVSSYINKCFHEKSPLVLFMAPGYDAQAKDFLGLLNIFETREKSIERLTLLGNKAEEIEVISLSGIKKQPLVFGLWPWQYIEWRKIKKIGEFNAFHFKPLNKDFYTADVEIELLEASREQVITLKGAALKTSLTEKTRLLILSNFSYGKGTAQEITEVYLNHWPNMEEAFEDFSRKVELFTYAVNPCHCFLTEESALSNNQDIRGLFNSYFSSLEAYLEQYFLPFTSKAYTSSFLKEQFYNLKAMLKKEKDLTIITLEIPSGYQFTKELNYACFRLNERAIIQPDGSKLWFKCGDSP
ncbi:MAG: hypothetical protein QMD94_00705 [Candidatus Omnitrophota bacterium]|nr:hypothetical protein [Candidatus Omnitrophota bacterium]